LSNFLASFLRKIQRERKSLYLTAFSALLISCGCAANARKKSKQRQKNAYLSLKRRIRKREKVPKIRKNTAFSALLWRKRWDSNPRAREDYLISSQARYDHFDTLPYILCVFFAFDKTQEKHARTILNCEIRTCEKP
jgi:mannose/cellobiose epimerase-like protein (N-acyl-D-glucosamine 2-epimerase family)